LQSAQLHVDISLGLRVGFKVYA